MKHQTHQTSYPICKWIQREDLKYRWSLINSKNIYTKKYKPKKYWESIRLRKRNIEPKYLKKNLLDDNQIDSGNDTIDFWPYKACEEDSVIPVLCFIHYCWSIISVRWGNFTTLKLQNRNQHNWVFCTKTLKTLNIFASYFNYHFCWL